MLDGVNYHDDTGPRTNGRQTLIVLKKQSVFPKWRFIAAGECEGNVGNGLIST